MQSLILLHGAIGAKDQLEPLANLLSKDFDLHTLNFSGHGDQPVPHKFSIDLFSDNLLCYIEALDLKDVCVFGYSMGGYVALYMARHYPEHISKVATLGTKFLWTPEIAEKETKLLNPDKIEEKLPHFAEQLKDRHLPNDWKEVLQKTSNMMHDLGNKNALELSDYKTIEIPVKLFLGDSDNMVTLQETKDVSEQLPNAQLNVLKDTPHPIEKVNLEILAEELKRVLN